MKRSVVVIRSRSLRIWCAAVRLGVRVVARWHYGKSFVCSHGGSGSSVTFNVTYRDIFFRSSCLAMLENMFTDGHDVSNTRVMPLAPCIAALLSH